MHGETPEMRAMLDTGRTLHFIMSFPCVNEAVVNERKTWTNFSLPLPHPVFSRLFDSCINSHRNGKNISTFVRFRTKTKLENFKLFLIYIELTRSKCSRRRNRQWHMRKMWINLVIRCTHFSIFHLPFLSESNPYYSTSTWLRADGKKESFWLSESRISFVISHFPGVMHRHSETLRWSFRILITVEIRKKKPLQHPRLRMEPFPSSLLLNPVVDSRQKRRIFREFHSKRISIASLVDLLFHFWRWQPLTLSFANIRRNKSKLINEFRSVTKSNGPNYATKLLIRMRRAENSEHEMNVAPTSRLRQRRRRRRPRTTSKIE